MKKFEDELDTLHAKLSQMAALTQSMVKLTTDVVQDRTKDVGDELEASEKRLDQMQISIDHEAVRLLTVYGPVAKSLRDLLVVTHVTAQLERMGDQCLNVLEAVQLMSSDPLKHRVRPVVQKLAVLVGELVNDALDSYFRKDAEKARATRTRDDMADALNDQIMKEIFTDDVLREVLEGARDIADAVAQVLIGRHLERIADQATNICKEVVYLVEGQDVRHRAAQESGGA
jgi:phosphate transport system protein